MLSGRPGLSAPALGRNPQPRETAERERVGAGEAWEQTLLAGSRETAVSMSSANSHRDKHAPATAGDT